MVRKAPENLQKNRLKDENTKQHMKGQVSCMMLHDENTRKDKTKGYLWFLQSEYFTNAAADHSTLF